MKQQRALELFFMKAREEFEKRRPKGSDVGIIAYGGCDFVNGKVRVQGIQKVSSNMVLPLSYDWEEGVEVFRTILKDMTE